MSEQSSEIRSAGERFLDSFAAIEQFLRKKTRAGREAFYRLVELAAQSDSAIRRFEVDLKEYADLRNAVVHERGGGQLIAEPHESTAKRIEEIRQVLASPPKLTSFFRAVLHSVDASHSVGEAARKMRAGDFSQLPVLRDASIIGLLASFEHLSSRFIDALLAE